MGSYSNPRSPRVRNTRSTRTNTLYEYVCTFSLFVLPVLSYCIHHFNQRQHKTQKTISLAHIVEMASKTGWIVLSSQELSKYLKVTRRHDDWSFSPNSFSLKLAREPIMKRIKRQQYITRNFEIFGPPIFYVGLGSMTRAIARDLMPIGTAVLLFDNESTFQKRMTSWVQWSLSRCKGVPVKNKGKPWKNRFPRFLSMTRLDSWIEPTVFQNRVNYGFR